MASKAYEDRYGDQPDVRVYRRLGCELCGSTVEHTHRAPDWREFIAGKVKGARGGGDS